MDAINWLLPELSPARLWVHGFILFANLGLLLLARPILNFIDGERDNATKLRLFRTLNVSILVLQALDFMFLSFNKSYENYFISVGFTLMALYASLFAYSLCSYFSRKRFGAEKQIDNKTVFLDTYSSRLVDIILLFLIAITTIYTLIKIDRKSVV